MMLKAAAKGSMKGAGSRKACGLLGLQAARQIATRRIVPGSAGPDQARLGMLDMYGDIR